MKCYLSLVTGHPLLMAMLQFALLGTLGEIISQLLKSKKLQLPYSTKAIIFKMVVWSILAVFIKFAFIGFTGFVDALAIHPLKLLPGSALQPNSLSNAFFISLFMNLFFGPFLILFHRYLDLLLDKTRGYDGVEQALYTLLWFWIPAHTLTFLLPKEYQIGLAALWSLILGVILGHTSSRAQPK